MTSVQIHKINTVLITGASSGIGLQLAKDYLAAGWHVIACGRDKAKLDALAETVLIGATCISFDINERSQVQENALRIKDLLTQCACQLDLVILNAGGCEYIDDAKHFDDRLFERVVHTNLIGHGLLPWRVFTLNAKRRALGTDEFERDVFSLSPCGGLWRFQSGRAVLSRQPEARPCSTRDICECDLPRICGDASNGQE